MINLSKLLCLALVGFCLGPKPVDNDRPKWLGDLPIDCLEKICSFGGGTRGSFAKLRDASCIRMHQSVRKVEMISPQKLLNLTLIGFFLAPELADNERPEKIFNLPKLCLKNIQSFHEACFVGPCCASCFKMFQVGYEFEKTAQIDEMIEKCRAPHSKDKRNYFSSYLDDEEKNELCLTLKDWKNLLPEAGELYYKYRDTNPPEGSDDLQKLERLESYKKMYKRMSSKQKIFYENQKNIYRKQLGFLKLYKVCLESSDTDSNSTSSGMSTIPEGSEYDSDSDSD